MLKNINYLYIFILFLISFIVNLHYGSIGVFPIDTFAFFDSSFSINNGFLPLRDYWTSNGLFVDLLQSVFFRLFGVNWYVYLIHSSLINFILVFLTYRFLNKQGLSYNLSFFYSCSVGILAYPPVGVPFSDHHSLIFSILAVYSLIFSMQKKSNLYLFITILLLFFAFLSKQIPAAFFIILTSSYIIYFSIKTKNYSFIYNSIIFSVILIIIFLIFLQISKISIKVFFIQYIDYPLSIGVSRSGGLEFQNFLKSLLNEFKFFFFIVLILIYQSFKIKKGNVLFNGYYLNILFILLIFISLINQELMRNQNIVFFILPILLGVIHSNLNLNKDRKSLFLLFSMITLNIFITLKYHERFNIDRKFMELEQVNKNKTYDASLISKNLNGLKWVTSVGQTQVTNEIDLLIETIKYLKANKNNSMILTEYQFIISEINHQIYSPNRWFTADGVSYPLQDNKYYQFYINFFKDQLKKNNIEKIYTILPLNKERFEFVLDKECIKTRKINQLLSENLLTNCF